MIQANAVTKSYGPQCGVANLDLTVAPGELVALVGENGAGKTTALRILSGQLVPDDGQALIGGYDIFAQAGPARRLLGYVSQDLLLPPHLTTAELAEFVCSVKQVQVDASELNRLLRLTGLDQDANRLVGELSFGMQRKAAWVVALIAHPSVLLADEGLSGLDAAGTTALAREISARLAAGVAVLWTEHDLALIAPYLTRLIVLHRGHIAEVIEGVEVRRQLDESELAASMRRWTSLPDNA